MNYYILIAAAVAPELSTLASMISMPVSAVIGGRKVLSGKINDTCVKLLNTGPGIANTVQALTATIEDLRPSLIIQTGCAGAFKESGFHIGDIGIATREIDVYVGIETETGGFPLQDLPFWVISQAHMKIKNSYPVSPTLVELAFNTLQETCAGKRVGLKKGPFVTVPTITATCKTARSLFSRYKAVMENMEGAGSAHVSMHYQIPFLEIRSASNMVGKRDTSLWDLPLAFKRASEAIFELVQKLPHYI